MAAVLLDDDGNPLNKSKPKVLDDNGQEIPDHPHAGLLDFLGGLDDKRREFLQNHPIISRLLSGPTAEDQAKDLLPSGKPAQLVGQEFPKVPGVQSAADALANKIDNPQGEGGTLRGFTAGAIHGVGGLLSTLAPLPVGGVKGNMDVLESGEQPKSNEPTPLKYQDAEIVPKQGDINLPTDTPLPKPNLPNEFAPVDAEVAPEVKNTSIATKTPEQIGYERILANKGIGADNLEPIPNGWSRVGENVKGDDVNKDFSIPDDVDASKGNVSDELVNKPNPNADLEHQELSVVKQPDTIYNQDGKQDGFAEPKFKDDMVPNPNHDNPAIPESSNIAPKGDITAYDSQYNSVNKVLDRDPLTSPISKILTDAQDIKPRWLYGKFREFEQPIQDLNKDQAIAVVKLQNHGVSDPAYNQANNITPDMINRANQLQSLFDDVHDFMVQMGVKGNNGTTNLGYLSNYIPHMQRGPNGMMEQIKDIWAHYVGRQNPFYKAMFDSSIDPNNTSTSTDIFSKGLAKDPWSQFTMTRKGNMNPADIEWDPRKVIPAYLESAARLSFDGPAIVKAENAFKQVESQLAPRQRELAAWAITNYSGYESRPNLDAPWDSITRSMAKKTAQSLISFSPGVHLLHLGEIPANIFPDLGPKYTAIGVKDLTTNLFSNFKEMAQLGLIQDEVKPMSFKTVGEKIDSIGYYRSYVESIVKAIAYRGAKAMYADQGLTGAELTNAAIKKAKDLTLTVDKSRQMMGLSPEAKMFGGASNKLTGQFKGIPLKFAEQQQEWIKQLAANPKGADAWYKVLKTLTGVGVAGALTYETGKKLVHGATPLELGAGAALGPFASLMGRIGTDAYMSAKASVPENLGGKPDPARANQYFMQLLIDSAAFFTPGGNQIKRLVKYGSDKGYLSGGITDPGAYGGKHNPKPMRLRFTTPSVK